jgi:hyperosmotically inducible protein
VPLVPPQVLTNYILAETMKNLMLLALPVMVLTAQGVGAQATPMDHASAPAQQSPSAPDNTKSNKQDPANVNHTADQQANNSADLDVTKRIRQSVMADKSLSTYGHNVKIVSKNGMVTLNGVVHSDDEKSQIAMKAAAVVGKDHVVNELKVSPAK